MNNLPKLPVKTKRTSLAPGVITYCYETLDLIVVTDGDVEYDNSCFAPDVTRAMLSQIRNSPSQHFLLPHNILVIKTADNLIMIDSGNGDKVGPSAGKLFSNLFLAGIIASDLTDIVLTHAHPDHFNGLISDSGQLTFPNAKIHIHQKEFDFWQDEHADFSKSKSSMTAMLSLQREVKSFFSKTSEKLQLFSTDEPLFDFLQPVLTPGHTPGHCTLTITSGTEKFVHLADIFHDEDVLFIKPEWGTVFDIDFELAASTRQRILEKFALSSKQRVFGYHLPWPGFGHIDKDNDTYKWVPESI